MDRGIDTRSPISKKSMQPRMLLLFRVYVWAMWICLVLFIFLNTTHARLFRIEAVRIEGNLVVPTELLEAYVAEKIFNQRSILPRDSSITLPRLRLPKDILHTWKSIESVRIRMEQKTLVVTVREYVPMYAYCDTRVCVGLTEQGKITTPILGQNTFIAFEGSLRSFTDRGYEREYVSPQFGEYILNADAWNQITQTIEVFEKNNIRVRSVELRPFHFFTITASYGLSQNIEFRFRADEHHLTRVDNTMLAWNEGLRARAENELLEYVISTIPEKVVYRFK